MVRTKERFLICQIQTEGALGTQLGMPFWRALEGNFAELYGDLEAAKLPRGFRPVLCVESVGLAVFRVPRDLLRKAWLSAALLKEVQGRRARVRGLRVAGSMRTAGEKVRDVARRELALSLGGGALAGARASLEDALRAARMARAPPPGAPP